MKTEQKQWTQKGWNGWGRHFVRVICILFLPVGTALHFLKAARDSVSDARRNFVYEMNVNWHDFMEYWRFTGHKLGPEYFNDRDDGPRDVFGERVGVADKGDASE